MNKEIVEIIKRIYLQAAKEWELLNEEDGKRYISLSKLAKICQKAMEGENGRK